MSNDLGLARFDPASLPWLGKPADPFGSYERGVKFSEAREEHSTSLLERRQRMEEGQQQMAERKQRMEQEAILAPLKAKEYALQMDAHKALLDNRDWELKRLQKEVAAEAEESPVAFDYISRANDAAFNSNAQLQEPPEWLTGTRAAQAWGAYNNALADRNKNTIEASNNRLNASFFTRLEKLSTVAQAKVRDYVMENNGQPNHPAFMELEEQERLQQRNTDLMAKANLIPDSSQWYDQIQGAKRIGTFTLEEEYWVNEAIREMEANAKAKIAADKLETRKKEIQKLNNDILDRASKANGGQGYTGEELVKYFREQALLQNVKFVNNQEEFDRVDEGETYLTITGFRTKNFSKPSTPAADKPSTPAETNTGAAATTDEELRLFPKPLSSKPLPSKPLPSRVNPFLPQGL